MAVLPYNIGYIDPDPDINDADYLMPVAHNVAGVTFQQASFVQEGSHTEPLLGQIWPRIG